jgi:hypothetical protein
MALDLKLNISTTEDCKNLVIEDVTGVYNETSNPGGWGGFNVDGNRIDFTMQLYLIAYHFIGDQQYTTPISLVNFENSVYYPAEDSYRSFKVSIPSYDISTEIANSPTIPETYDPMKEIVEDGMYSIVVNLQNEKLNYKEEFEFSIKSICNSQKIVEKMMGSVNLGCEDCDDADIERALLAKSLLEVIKNMR